MNALEDYLNTAQQLGIVPYIATSENYINTLDTSAFGGREIVRLLERDEDIDFHNAYIYSNFLGFGGTDVEMPNWVYIDFILLQTAVIGFAIEKSKAPKSLLMRFAERPGINLSNMDYIPISGQTAGAAINGETLMGFSLFSLKYLMEDLAIERLGLATKAIGLHAQRADKYKEFIGISQYNNRALRIHGRFGEKMFIKTPMVAMHPMSDMTMIYSMKVDLSNPRIFNQAPAIEDSEYSFLLNANDKAAKQDMSKRITNGEKFYIAPPFQILQDDAIHLPIKVENT